MFFVCLFLCVCVCVFLLFLLVLFLVLFSHQTLSNDIAIVDSDLDPVTSDAKRLDQPQKHVLSLQCPKSRPVDKTDC